MCDIRYRPGMQIQHTAVFVGIHFPPQKSKFLSFQSQKFEPKEMKLAQYTNISSYFKFTHPLINGPQFGKH